MKRIMVSIKNQLLSEAIFTALTQTGDFRPERVLTDRLQDTAYLCKSTHVEILLMDVTSSPDATLEQRLETGRQVHSELLGCKVVLLCDENSDPALACKVKEAKQLGLIDAFFYVSVTTGYLMAALDAL